MVVVEELSDLLELGAPGRGAARAGWTGGAAHSSEILEASRRVAARARGVRLAAESARVAESDLDLPLVFLWDRPYPSLELLGKWASMPKGRNELLKGTLDLLVMKVIAAGPAHGYGVAERIQNRSDGELLVEEGSLYPALHRLERRGWLRSEWGLSEQNRRAKFYRLSRSGRSELTSREENWARVSSAIERVLRTAAVGG